MSLVNDRPRFIFAIVWFGLLIAIIGGVVWGTPKLMRAVSDWRNDPVVTVSPDTVQYSDTTARSRMTLLANGNSTVRITTGSYTVTMRAEDMVICMMTEPAESLIAPDSMSMTIEPSHPWYPKPGGRTVYVARCAGFDGSTQYDTVIVSR